MVNELKGLWTGPGLANDAIWDSANAFQAARQQTANKTNMEAITQVFPLESTMYRVVRAFENS